MAEIKTVFRKLRLSWIVTVVTISFLGCCVSLVLTFHDSYVKDKSYSKFKELIGEDVNTRKNIEDLLSSRSRARDIQEEFRSGCQNASDSMANAALKEKIDLKLKEFCGTKNVQFGNDNKFIAEGCEYGVGFVIANSGLGKVPDASKAKMTTICVQKTENDFLNSETNMLAKYKDMLTEAGFVYYGFDSRYSIHLKNLWGGNEYTTLASLVYALNWLLGGAIILLISYFLERWLYWVLRKEP